MKKSVVATRAWVSFSRQTAASSDAAAPTIRSEKAAVAGMPFRIDCSTAGASLQPQPPPWASEVRRGVASGAIAVIGSLIGRLGPPAEGLRVADIEIIKSADPESLAAFDTII